MDKSHEQRRDAIREVRITQGLKAFRRGEIEGCVEKLTIAGARAELSNCLSQFPIAVREQLEVDRTKVAINAYRLLEDDTALHKLASRLFDRGRNGECTDALLAMSSTANLQLVEYLEKFTERQIFDQVERLLPSAYPQGKLQEVQAAEGETRYSRFVTSVHGKLLASFEQEKGAGDQRQLTGSVRRMIDVLDYCGEYAKLREFYTNCTSAEDCVDWQYYAGQQLLAAKQSLPDDLIDFLSKEAIARHDESTIGMILSHRFDRDKALMLAQRLIGKHREQAITLLMRVLETDQVAQDAMLVLAKLLRNLTGKDDEEKDKRRKRR